MWPPEKYRKCVYFRKSVQFSRTQHTGGHMGPPLRRFHPCLRKAAEGLFGTIEAFCSFELPARSPGLAGARLWARLAIAFAFLRAYRHRGGMSTFHLQGREISVKLQTCNNPHRFAEPPERGHEGGALVIFFPVAFFFLLCYNRLAS